MEELTLIKNRFNDLASRSYDRGIYTYSEFLTMAEQSELKKMHLPVKCSLFGGYDSAERCIAVFGSEDEFGYECSPPVVFIRIAPVQMKFADDLTHRDFLGSLMALGIKREMLGDIIIKDNRAFLICMESIAEYIISQLDKVRHTSVVCEISDVLPENVLPEFECQEIIVASERIDVLISAVYNLSRNESQKRIESETVFCNSIMINSTSFVPQAGSIISVRGCGRFIVESVLRTTKKGRLVVAIKKY